MITTALFLLLLFLLVKGKFYSKKKKIQIAKVHQGLLKIRGKHINPKTILTKKSLRLRCLNY